MKALSLWQPWASLIAVGAKRIETRDWPAPKSLHGQRIAIHAAKRWTPDLRELASSEPFYTQLRVAVGAEGSPAKDLPLGAIVCTAVLKRSTAITSDAVELLRRRAPLEHVFGNYMPGRFAWVLSAIERPPEPVECRGFQRLWDLDSEIAAAITGQVALL